MAEGFELAKLLAEAELKGAPALFVERSGLCQGI